MMDVGRLDLVAGRLLVQPSGVWPEMKELGGRWDPRLRAWVFPTYATYAQSVKEAKPHIEVTEKANRLLNGYGFPVRDTEVALEELAAPYRAAYDKLYPYQQEAVEYLYSSDRPGALLALSPGLGKSAVAMVTARLLDAQSVLVISPLALLATWERESKMWAGRQLTRAYGKGPGEDNWVVTNYDTVVRRAKEYKQREWDIVILDESILVKNRDTKRFLTMKALRATARRLWLLSGSPTSRYADDLWAQLHLIDATAFRSYWRFTTRYCWLEETSWGTNVIGTREDRDMQNDFRDIMFVRHQREVLPDLPEYLVEEVLVELTPSQKKAHEELRRSFITQLESGEVISADIKLTQMLRMQQATSSLANFTSPEADELGIEAKDYREGGGSAKHDAIVDMLEAGSFDLPAIVWTHWRQGAETLYRRLKNEFKDLRVALAYGQSPTNEAVLKAYVDGEVDILILSLGVGKFGLTMVDTQTVIYLDKTFNADDYIQSRQRVQRIGLDHKPLMITLKAPGTVDEVVEDNLAGKFIGIAKMTNSDLARLLEGLGR